jgi:hypothetical protein
MAELEASNPAIKILKAAFSAIQLACQPLGIRITLILDGNRRRLGFDTFRPERLISRQKVARATALVMWSTLAISFQANPL